jgi:membrane-bound lytic murein transglycosylase A
MSRSFPVFLVLLALAGCSQLPPQAPAQTPAPTTATATCPAPQACPACPVCPTVEPPKPAEKPLQAAEWNELTGWTDDDPSAAFAAFIASCRSLERQAHWKPVCASARDLSRHHDRRIARLVRRQLPSLGAGQSRRLAQRPHHRLLRTHPQGQPAAKQGLPQFPVFGPPDDLIVVELAELYPELKHLRLRGRLEGRKLVPFIHVRSGLRRKASAHQRPCFSSTTRSISSSCRSRARGRFSLPTAAACA